MMEMALLNMFLQKIRIEGRSTQVDYILSRRGIGDCLVVAGDSVTRQPRMLVCRMILSSLEEKECKCREEDSRWNLESWSYVLERRRIKFNLCKTEYICVCECEGGR